MIALARPPRRLAPQAWMVQVRPKVAGGTAHPQDPACWHPQNPIFEKGGLLPIFGTQYMCQVWPATFCKQNERFDWIVTEPARSGCKVFRHGLACTPERPERFPGGNSATFNMSRGAFVEKRSRGECKVVRHLGRCRRWRFGLRTAGKPSGASRRPQRPRCTGRSASDGCRIRPSGGERRSGVDQRCRSSPSQRGPRRTAATRTAQELPRARR